MVYPLGLEFVFKLPNFIIIYLSSFSFLNTLLLVLFNRNTSTPGMPGGGPSNNLSGSLLIALIVVCALLMQFSLHKVEEGNVAVYYRVLVSYISYISYILCFYYIELVSTSVELAT